MKLRHILIIIFLFVLWKWYKSQKSAKTETKPAQKPGSGLTPGGSGLVTGQSINPITGEVTTPSVVTGDIQRFDERNPADYKTETTTPGTTTPTTGTTTPTTGTTSTSTVDVKPTTTDPVKPPQPAPTFTTASSSAESKFRMARQKRRNSCFL